MRDLRDHAAQTGQSTVEFALLALAFFLTFFIVIQLALIAVAKHELNHLTFQAARVWSLQKSDKIEDAIKQTAAAYKAARDNSRMARYLADNLTAKADDKSGRVTFTAYIPLVVPGAAHVIQNAANARGRGSPTGRDIAATIVVQMKREPKLGWADHPKKDLIYYCKEGPAGKSEKDLPPCFDNDGI